MYLVYIDVCGYVHRTVVGSKNASRFDINFSHANSPNLYDEKIVHIIKYALFIHII